MKIAVTGATGFVGARLLSVARQADQRLTCLTRSFKQERRRNISWIEGSLEDRESLDLLCEHADTVIHIAGVINASKQGFFKGNAQGTENLVEAAKRAGVQRFVHVSSLAAREPQLSHYGASKAASEEIVASSGLDHVIVRPPAVYGPGDTETLELFKMARRRVMFLPPRGRLSLIHGDDLARLLLVLAKTHDYSGHIFEPDDGREHGYSHRQFGKMIGNAVKRPVATVSMPGFVLKGAARIDRMVRGRKAKLTPDRAAYFSHRDWVVTHALRPPAKLWIPKHRAQPGLDDTAAWYRAQGWL